MSRVLPTIPVREINAAVDKLTDAIDMRLCKPYVAELLDSLTEEEMRQLRLMIGKAAENMRIAFNGHYRHQRRQEFRRRMNGTTLGKRKEA